jgi:hypothetical protein
VVRKNCEEKIEKSFEKEKKGEWNGLNEKLGKKWV